MNLEQIASSVGLVFDYDSIEGIGERDQYVTDSKTGMLKRINPDTGNPFKFSEVDEETGLVFRGYDSSSPKKGSNVMRENWATLEVFQKHRKSVLKAVKNMDERIISGGKEGHIRSTIKSIKGRAKTKELPFDLDVEYLISIAPDFCPVLGFELTWGLRTKTRTPTAPSLDRIKPALGYVKGNVQYLSNMANTMKQNASFDQLKQFGEWAINFAREQNERQEQQP
jgi:hypothetical protein